jgi:hypothetical protein
MTTPREKGTYRPSSYHPWINQPCPLCGAREGHYCVNDPTIPAEGWNIKWCRPHRVRQQPLSKSLHYIINNLSGDIVQDECDHGAAMRACAVLNDHEERNGRPHCYSVGYPDCLKPKESA